MNISELKVGMIVRRDLWTAQSEVLLIHGGYVVLKGNESSSEHHWCSNFEDGWIEVKPKKKPSERIRELSDCSIAPRKATGALTDEATHARNLFSIIVKYLDEREAEGK